MAKRGNKVAGKVQRSVWVDPEVDRAWGHRAVDMGVSKSQVVEDLLRRELDMAKLSWQVIEDNAGGLHLAVSDGKNVIFYGHGYERNEDGLRADLDALSNGDDPRTNGWEQPDDVDDPQASYDRLTGSEHGWQVVADEDDVYYDRMGTAAQRVFLVPWGTLELFDRDNDAVTDTDRSRAALSEFREIGSMNGLFFKRIGWPHEDDDDASTWGPQSPDAVDWTGFEE